MTTQKIFNLLKEEIGDDLTGEIEYNGEVIKYQYDSFQKDIDLDIDLYDICDEDRTIIDEWLSSDDNYDDFFTTEPEIDDTIIYFYIEK